MKKQLLFLAAAIIICGSSFAQGYYYIKTKGNPKFLVGTVNGTNYDYKKAIRGTGAASVLALPAEQVFSAAQTLPFAWNFFGIPVTQYKVSDNGFLTFNISDTTNPINPVALPSVNAPKNAIFGFWYNFKLAAGTGIVDQVSSWTYGSAPNRIHVVQWLSCTTPAGGLGSFAIRIYEGKGFDVITNQASAVVNGTIGANNADGTVGISSLNAPATPFDASSADDDYANMGVWYFISGTQPANEIELTSINIPKYVGKNVQLPITGTITNYGSQNLSSFKLNYSVDNGPTVTMQLTSLNVTPSGGTYDFTHNMPYTGTAPATSTIKVWVTSPNAGIDGDSTNNQLTGTFIVTNPTVARKVLHEIFTSSTCPPCKPGNENLNSILDIKLGGWNLIKYQENFPGNGDPYYTLENGARFSYYGAKFAPWLTVDGSSTYNSNTSQGANANFYTEDHFNTKAAVGGLATIAATYTRTGKTVTVAGTVTPIQAFTNPHVKVRISIVERITKKNVASNGEIEFYNVNKKMLPDANGTTLNLTAGTPVSFTQSFTFPGSYRLPADGLAASIINLSTENSIEEFGALSAIVFVQDDDDKFVWNSYGTAPQWILGINEVSDLGLNLYPNPANSSFNITFTGASNSALVRIVDINGREVLNQNISNLNGTINCDQLQNGLYFVELNANGKTAVKKLNIIR